MKTIRIFQNGKQVGGAFTFATAMEKCRRWAYQKPGAKLVRRNGEHPLAVKNHVGFGALVGYGEASAFTYVVEDEARKLDAENLADIRARHLKGAQRA